MKKATKEKLDVNFAEAFLSLSKEKDQLILEDISCVLSSDLNHKIKYRLVSALVYRGDRTSVSMSAILGVGSDTN